MRTESRGVHYRDDYPVTDNDNWLKEITVTSQNGSLELDQRPLTITSMNPPTGVTPYMEFIRQMMEAHSDTGGKH
jgi:fumarate reductase flavoprotein